MNSYTPGPWTAKPTASLGPQWKVYPEADGPDIAIVYDHGDTEANARLIAAAPDLLAACEAAVAWNLTSATQKDWTSYRLAVLETIRAAIAKAQGRDV